MKLFFDYLPIVVFFAAYYLGDIYMATASAIVASILQVGVMLAMKKRPEMMHWMALGMIVLLGGATLFLHDEMFIKWKPTAVYWILSLIFLASQWVGKKPIVQRMLESNIELDRPKWKMLNLSWVFFFAIMGVLNVYIIYHFSTTAWVNFKLFGSLILTFVFVIGQALFLMKHMPSNGDKS